MAVNLHHHALLFIIAVASCSIANAGDPDITSDFIVPFNLTPFDGNFFTFTGMRQVVRSDDPPKTFTVTKASMAEFPALNGQSVSYAVLMFPPGSVNPPHTHPRASELLFLIDGSLVHFQFSNGNDTAVAISAFGSASAGLVSIPAAVFESGIDDGILAKSFKTDLTTVQMIKAGLAPKN